MVGGKAHRAKNEIAIDVFFKLPELIKPFERFVIKFDGGFKQQSWMTMDIVRMDVRLGPADALQRVDIDRPGQKAGMRVGRFFRQKRDHLVRVNAMFDQQMIDRKIKLDLAGDDLIGQLMVITVEPPGKFRFQRMGKRTMANIM